MTRLRTIQTIAVGLLALASLQCTAETGELDIAQTRSALSAVDETLCAARASAVVANTGSITVNAQTLVDSYDSDAGAYGAPNTGSSAVLRAGTRLLNNGGVIRGSVIERSPSGLPALTPPSGATILPWGASSPGSLNINSASDSLVLSPGDYVVRDVNINGSGTINIVATGEVRIWVTGNLNLGGAVNNLNIPREMAFILPNSGWVNLNGGQFHGLLYAPRATVNVNAAIFGTVVGRSVTLNSGAAVHFDVSSTCYDSEAEVDQSLVTPGGLTAGVYGPGSAMAQIYTAGLTGDLTGASVALDAWNPDYLARIQVRTVVDGHPSDVVLGEGMATTGGDVSINTVIEFPSPIAQVAGEQYALVVNYPDAPPFVDNAWPVADWVGNQNNAYPQGTLTYSNDDGATWEPEETDGDLLFQTYVIPD